MEIVVNPLVNWVWVGFGILALGTGIALLPDTVFAFAIAKIPANAVTTSLLLLSLLLWPAVARRAERARTWPSRSAAQLQRQLESEIMCTCGCRSPMGSCPMRPNCGSLRHAGGEAERPTSPKARTTTRCEAAFVQEFGSQAVLAAPIDQGFNRLAWLFPYLVAAAGARRHRRDRTPLVATRPRPAATGDAGLDPALNARLDDELRNLD